VMVCGPALLPPPALPVLPLLHALARSETAAAMAARVRLRLVEGLCMRNLSRRPSFLTT
jgi:hypothetical protein